MIAYWAVMSPTIGGDSMDRRISAGNIGLLARAAIGSRVNYKSTLRLHDTLRPL